MDSKKLKVNIAVLLPESPDEHDACVHRLITALEKKDGIRQVHLEGETHNKILCVHYDPDVISLTRVEAITKAEGALLTETFGHAVFDITPPRHIRHAEIIKRKLQGIDGVLGARVSGTGKVSLEFDRKLTGNVEIKKRVGKIVSLVPQHVASETKEAHSHEEHEGEHKHGMFGLGERAELAFSVASAVMLGLGFSIEKWTDVQAWIPLSFYIASYFFGGFFTLTEAVENLKRKRFEIDTLMLVAAIGAAVLGEWAEGALLLVLFSLGHALEHYAM